MEKTVEATTRSNIRIILTGPESTGKTELAATLAGRYKTVYSPEYAREYIENLGRPYVYDDLKQIAKHQIHQMEAFSSRNLNIFFIDTYLIITKVWFEWVYNKYPAWLDAELRKTKSDLYLLCRPDIPWFPDNVRENGGEKRMQLFDLYEKELLHYGLQYRFVSGKGEDRIMNAVEQLENHLVEKGIIISE